MRKRTSLLQELEIVNCKIMEEIVGIKGEKDKEELTSQVTNFSQLKYMKLCNLPKLISFYPKMEKATTSDENSSTQCLFNEKVEFPLLENLEIDELSNIKEIWDKQLLRVPQKESNSSCQLQSMTVFNCENMMNVVRSNMLPRLQNLKYLHVSGCPKMEVIVLEKAKEKEATNDDIIVFPQLITLHLGNLMNLKSFCSWPTTRSGAQPLFNHQVSFPSLEKLRVSHCGSARTLFHPSMPRYLVNLQELIIDKCLMMEEVVPKEGDDKIGDEMKDVTLFPKLSYLELNDLPVLRSFCHITLDWELPLLESVSVFDCPEMKNLAPGLLRTPNLQVVWLKWWAPDGGVEGFWTSDLNLTMLHLYEKRERAQSPDAAGLTDLSFPTSSTSPSTSLRSWRRLRSWTRLRSLMRF